MFCRVDAFSRFGVLCITYNHITMRQSAALAYWQSARLARMTHSQNYIRLVMAIGQ
jgi:hypothetical protein